MNIYNAQPELDQHTTLVSQTHVTPEGLLAISLQENILRPSGGGQPHDHGELLVNDAAKPVRSVFKLNGETWLEIDYPAAGLAIGDTVLVKLDRTRRLGLSRRHSLTHLAMASLRTLVPGFESKGAAIDDGPVGATLFFRADRPPTADELDKLADSMRALIEKRIPIRIEKARSLEAAARAYPYWRVDPDSALTGRIRIVHIEGIDANPCSGSHVAHTGEIGPFGLADLQIDAVGVHALRVRSGEGWC